MSPENTSEVSLYDGPCFIIGMSSAMIYTAPLVSTATASGIDVQLTHVVTRQSEVPQFTVNSCCTGSLTTETIEVNALAVKVY